MNYLPQSCQKCDGVPDDILMLSCSHDLCVDCASECYGIQQASKKKKTNTLYCDVCGTVTSLETESVQQLDKLFMSRQPIQNRKAINLKINNLLNQSALSHKNYKQNGKENKSLNNTTLMKPQLFSSSKIFCNVHRDEEVTYYCFDCNTNCICSECVIHGDHKNHNVKTVRKAYPHIKIQVQEILEKTKSTQKTIDQQREEIQQRQDQQKQFIAKIKTQIEKEFEELRLFLEKREYEIIHQLYQIPETTIYYESFLSNIYNVQQEVQKINHDIQEHLQAKDEISTLNFYSNICQLQFPEVAPLKEFKDLQLNIQDLVNIIYQTKQSLYKYSIQNYENDTFIQGNDSLNYNLSKSSSETYHKKK